MHFATIHGLMRRLLGPHKQRYIIRHRWALGDTVLLTALIRDIHRAYPGKYDIQVDTHWANVWEHNPYLANFTPDSRPAALVVEVGWGDAIRWNSRARYGDRQELKHILAWYHYDFELKTGIKVPVTDPRPDLHLTAEERIRRIQGRYWVVVSGGKLDLTTKHWHTHRMQEVVDKLAAKGIPCVQVGAANTNHIHPPLQRVTNLIGQTENVRDLWNVILHSDGVICGVTGAMHIAAAFERPCVVYGGGREEPWFEAYTNAFSAFGDGARPVGVEHKFLHTLGLLDCCDTQGCWKRRTIPLDPQDLTRKSHTMCTQPVRPEHSHPVPRCQDLILSDHVVGAVMEYYDQRVLPPISVPEPQNPPQIPEFNPKTPAEIQIPQVALVRHPSVEIKEQRAFQKVHPLELTPARVGTIPSPLAVMDHPLIGGKLTVCVLCYGPYTDLIKKCLSGILNTLPPERIDLRVATNAAVPATLAYLRTLPISKIYVNTENRFKYPLMREMFWDEQRPIATNYVVWFDDDTWVADPRWVTNLCQTIIEHHPNNARMFGSRMSHDLSVYAQHGGRPDLWFRTADWYRGRDLRLRSGQPEAPNGSVIDFAVGWCWAIATEAIREANIPDVRLGHNGGDITIGEQMHQAGLGIQSWNKAKSLIACPSRENGGRRGYSEKFPWDPTS